MADLGDLEVADSLGSIAAGPLGSPYSVSVRRGLDRPSRGRRQRSCSPAQRLRAPSSLTCRDGARPVAQCRSQGELATGTRLPSWRCYPSEPPKN